MMAKKNRWLLVLATTLAISANASEIKYPVSAIPDALKQNVDVVIREDVMMFKITARNHAVHKVHYVVTILNEKGNSYAEHSIGYDKLTKIWL